MPKKLTTDEFISKAISIHGDTYEYTDVIYIKSQIKVKIKCKKHGFFKQTPNNHLDGKGCRLCQIDNSKSTTETFIQKSTKIHGTLYNYNKVSYNGVINTVCIVCNTHGDFQQTPTIHLQGHGCPKCDIDKRKLTLDEFINRSNVSHNHKYTYDNSVYVTIKTPIIITCTIHGNFTQIPHNHLNGYGCPKCKSSKGEIFISNLLDDMDILYSTQQTFDGCKNKLPLRFDFYIESLNTLIEYDGAQHFTPSDYFGGITALHKIQHNDSIKNKFAIDNGIKIIRIKYTLSFDEIRYMLTYILS